MGGYFSCNVEILEGIVVLLMIKKLKAYFLYTAEDKDFVTFSRQLFENAKDSNLRGGEHQKKILVDCSHLSYSKWNIKLLLIVSNRLRSGIGEVHGFYPSRFFIWNTFNSLIISLLKAIFNKDKILARSIGVTELKRLGFSSFKLIYESYKLAKFAQKTFQNKKDLLSFSIEGVVVGDLIYDTYLKWYRKPTVDIHDKRLLMLLIAAHYLFKKFSYLSKIEKYEEVYLTHSVYLVFGIAARVSLKHGASVFITQNTRGLFLQRLSDDHVHQTPRFEGYKQSFSLLDSEEQTAAICLARKKLHERLSGKVDGSISYMRKSAYSFAESGFIDLVEYFPGKPYALIMLHCFFDSPHIYRWMIFEDFYEWVVHCLELLEVNELNVIVKGHPNGLNGNQEVVENLKKRFHKANFLSSQINNNDLLRADNIKVALTVYGTMAHEFCYKGVPVINAGDNPHIAYGFSKTPRTVEAFNRAVIDSMAGVGSDIETEEVEQFYYMNYLADKPGYIRCYDEQIEAGFSCVARYREIFDVIDKITLAQLNTEIDRCLEELSDVVKKSDNGHKLPG